MASNVSEETLSSYRDAFNLFDKDSSGTINVAELGDVMRSLGRTLSDKELAGILHEIDTDHNGTIEFSEFVDLMGRNPLSPKLAGGAPWGEDSELYYAFSVFDKDSSGKISVDELEQVMKNLGERLTKEELDIMISEADLDGDKEINFTEFKKMVGGLSK